MVEELTRTQISDHQSLNLLCAQLMACRTPQNFLLRAISTQINTLISKHQLQNTCFNSLADRVAIILQTPQVPSTQHGSMYMYPRAQDPVRFEYESSERRAVPIGAIATMPR